MESDNVGAVREPPNVETRDLASRVEKLEKANRRLTWIALAFGAGFILMFALAAAKPASVPDVIRAKKIEIVDDLGKVRISLELNPIMPAAKWMSKAQQESLKKSEINLSDGEGKLRARLFAIDSGSLLEFVDENSFERVSMALIGDKPHMRIRDSKGNTVWQAPPK